MTFKIQPQKCAREGCENTYIPHHWGKKQASRDGWFLQRNGMSWCPIDVPDWVEGWREQRNPYPRVDTGGLSRVDWGHKPLKDKEKAVRVNLLKQYKLDMHSMEGMTCWCGKGGLYLVRFTGYDEAECAEHAPVTNRLNLEVAP